MLIGFTAQIDRALKNPRRHPVAFVLFLLCAVVVIANGVFAVRTLVKLARPPRQIAEDSLAIIAKATRAKEVDEAAIAIISSGMVGSLDLAPLIAWVERDMTDRERTGDNYQDDFGAVLNAVLVFGKYDASGASLPVLARIASYHPKDDIITGYKYLQVSARKAELEIAVRKAEDTLDKVKAARNPLGLPPPSP